jgi:hypothetical protein
VTRGAPPTIIFHGDADTTIPFAASEVFTRVMRAAGNRCELVRFPGQAHGFFNFTRADNRPYHETLAATDAFLVSLGYLPPAPSSARPPNVIVILTDDLGYGDLGVYGAKGYATPHLDRLAREGTMFTNFHVAQPVCSASRAALLTGAYSNRIGIHGALGPNATHGLNASETTLPEIFKARGYATGMAGKWHLGHHAPFQPNQHGFDESFPARTRRFRSTKTAASLIPTSRPPRWPTSRNASPRAPFPSSTATTTNPFSFTSRTRCPTSRSP